MISSENLGNTAKQGENKVMSFQNPEMTTTTITDIHTSGPLPMQIITNALPQNWNVI